MKEPVPTFNHDEVVKKLAEKYKQEPKVANRIVNMFFTQWGIMYFLHRYQFPFIKGVFKFKPSKFTEKVRGRDIRVKILLDKYRTRDRKNGRPDNY